MAKATQDLPMPAVDSTVILITLLIGKYLLNQAPQRTRMCVASWREDLMLFGGFLAAFAGLGVRRRSLGDFLKCVGESPSPVVEVVTVIGH